MKLPTMKKVAFTLMVALFLFGIDVIHAQSSLKVGSKAPMLDHSVQDVNERSITLTQIAESNGLLVIFSCNTCPWVSRWEDRMKSVANTARINNIGMIALNPNERIRNRGESLSDMKRRSTKQTYNFVYALDQDHTIADAFGATKTPEVFLFDANMNLVYKGSIDDNPNNITAVKNQYLENAIQAMMEGKPAPISKGKLQGCSIKRIK